eukprot:m.73197 g.73197  ORF g.73197 m.73197 type:complete len:202 (+) comp14326_c0_seq1:217-822(+)
MSMALARVRREIQEVRKDKQIQECQIKLTLPDESNMRHLLGEVLGPPDTPYHGGTFQLDIQIPDQYPFSPPKVKFITKIWHPNVSSQTGAICLDILKDQWAAAMTLRTVLLSIQALMAAAEPDDPQDAVVAGQYKEHRDQFEATASHWSFAYAGGKGGDQIDEQNEKIKQLADMGFGEADARTALSSKNWVVETALQNLLS